MKMRLKSVCPYCGHENPVIADVNYAGRNDITQVVTCDCEEGGCDCDYVFSAVVQVTASGFHSRKIEGEAEKYARRYEEV